MSPTYLILDICTLVPTLAFSFHPRIRFYRHWPTLFPALAISALIFLSWDIYFTRIGVWGFNPHYLMGHYLINLPVEEWLFFLCIPYACVFTDYNLKFIRKFGPGVKTEKILTGTLIGILLASACFNASRRYTAATFFSLGLLLAYCSFVHRAKWLAGFYLSWLVLLLPLLLVDGILTGTGLATAIVWYNPRDILGIRILTIPVEDLFYGMELILLNVLSISLLRNTSLGKRSAPASSVLSYP